MKRTHLSYALLGLLLAACGGPEPESKTPVIVIDHAANNTATDDEGDEDGTTADEPTEAEPDDEPRDDNPADPPDDETPDEPRVCNLDCPTPAPRCRGAILEVPRGTATCNDDTFDCEGETWDEISCADTGQICSNGACIDTPKRAFLTAALYDGDLKAVTAEFDGNAAADALCQLEADGAQIGGTWKAWISSRYEDAIDRIADVGPWYLVNGSTLVANSVAQLATTGPSADITMHPNRQQQVDFGAWTGSNSAGRYSGADCNDWSTDDYQVEGQFGVDGGSGLNASRWTDQTDGDCDIRRHLYCFEQ